MKMFEVQYTVQYSSEMVTEVEQITEKRLQEIRKWESKGRYYSKVKVLRDFGEIDETWIPTWLEIGRRNLWIRKANDPPFNEESFAECKTIEYLLEKFEHGNWSLGQAFYYKDLCFINQVNGGDEWLTIRRDVNFESMGCGYIIKRDGKQKMIDLIERCLKATDEQLNKLDY